MMSRTTTTLTRTAPAAALEPPPCIGTAKTGIVTGHRSFGVLATIDGHRGLLHESRIPAGVDFVTAYPVGSQVDFAVLAHRVKGLELGLVPVDPAAGHTLGEDPFAVGDVRVGVVARFVNSGVLVSIGKRRGLLHKSRVTGWDWKNMYRVGTEVRVKVLSKSDDRIDLEPA